MELTRIGVVFGSLTPPEHLAAGAAAAEALGYGELWFSEDCFFTGGVSGLTEMLAATERVAAGLGLASVMTRHPAVFAMELAGLARMHPRRVRAGIGLGNVEWLQQMGVLPDRPLTAVRETFEVLRALLGGETVHRRTSVHEVAGVQLAFAPATPPELWLGAVNRRALALAGEVADGVLLSVLAGPDYVAWAADVVARASQRSAPPITAYVLTAVHSDAGVARAAVRDAVGFFLRAEAHTALVEQSPFAAAIRARVEALAPDEALHVEDEWVDHFAVAGDARTVRERLQGLLDAGASSVGLWVFPPERLVETLGLLADESRAV